MPEVPMTVLAEDLDPVQLGRAHGLRTAAIVHDLIPMRLGHLYDTATTRLYRRYYRMFTDADLVLATTHLVAEQLRDHLQAEGLQVPRILVVALPAELPGAPRCTAKAAIFEQGPLRLLTVSTWEPRKNLLRLLRAVQAVQRRGERPIELTIVGRRDVYPAYDDEVDALLVGMAGATARAHTDDAALTALYECHHASVYPSTEEGFGLPILESLWLGTPCVCHAGSAMAEVAPGGGTLMLDMADVAALADALVDLTRAPGLLERLTREALSRPLRSWVDYAGDVAQAMAMATRIDAGA